LAFVVFVFRVFQPEHGIFKEMLFRQPGGWLDRLRHVWFPFLLALPAGLCLLAALGYYYTATQLNGYIRGSVALIFAVLVLNGLILRWILLTRRRLAIEQIRKRRAAAGADDKTTSAVSREAVAEIIEPEIDLSAISAQTANLVHSLISVALLVGLWVVWSNVLPALGFLNRVELWSTTETVTANANATGAEGMATTRIVPVTLGNLMASLVILVLTFAAAKNFPGLLEIVLLQRLPLENSSRYAITTISRYIITVAGLIFTFGAVGIRWSSIQWLAAAITVGLGFGLQEIFANFVSGLIILFERPVRVGDVVTVAGIDGVVTRIRVRATTVTDWNRKELIIPNKELVTGQVINWTLSDRTLRIVIPVGIAYGSDTRKAREILLDIACRNPRVLKDPAPSALFQGFGASSLNFELRCFVGDMPERVDVSDELYFAIDDEFRKAGIEIAFPQQDVHVRTIAAELPGEVARTQRVGEMSTTKKPPSDDRSSHARR